MRACNSSINATKSGADGSLVGYGGGLPRKRALLDLEAGKHVLGFTAGWKK
jgi:hypothetical protein